MRVKIQATLLMMALVLIASLGMYALFYFVPGVYENFQNASGMRGELWAPKEYVIRMILITAAMIFPIYGFVSMVIDLRGEEQKNENL